MMIDNKLSPVTLRPSPVTALPEVLNLGCGRRRVEGAVNVDVTARTRPDVVHDLNVRPWPLPAGHFREVIARDVIEHLEDTFAVFEEIHRVARAGAVVRVTVPHFSSSDAYSDPTHRRFFARASLDFLDESNENSFYTTARFRERACRIVFRPSLTNRLVERLANRRPASYERRWAWTFPAWFIYFELEVSKGEGD